MTKTTQFLLTIICIFAVVACGPKPEDPPVQTMPQFVWTDDIELLTYSDVQDHIHVMIAGYDAHYGKGSGEWQVDDGDFVEVDVEWLKDFTEWWNSYRHEYIRYRKERFDCDNFADLFVSLAHITAINNREGSLPGQILVGKISVEQHKDFSGILASDNMLHQLCIACTTEGIYVIEPQTGRMIDLDEYPNRDYIYRVVF